MKKYQESKKSRRGASDFDINDSGTPVKDQGRMRIPRIGTATVPHITYFIEGVGSGERFTLVWVNEEGEGIDSVRSEFFQKGRRSSTVNFMAVDDLGPPAVGNYNPRFGIH